MSEISDEALRAILSRMRVVACVGWSPRPQRPSHEVAQFLHRRGLRVIPINPGHAGTTALGETVAASLSALEPATREAIDFLDIFRRSEAVAPVVDEALRVLPNLRTVWMQIGVINTQAAGAARAAGVSVVMDRCPAIEMPRLLG